MVHPSIFRKHASIFLKYYDKRHFQRRDKEIKIRGGKTNIINVETFTLKTICDTHNIKKIDYLSIDVEGGELSVIQSIDFNKVFIDIPLSKTPAFAKAKRGIIPKAT